MPTDLHTAQASILRELLFQNGTNFASLNKLGLTNDHFTFHLQKLVEGGYVEKTASSAYDTSNRSTVLSFASLHQL